MGTQARVKLIYEDRCIRQLYMSMDGYPSHAGRQVLAAVVPLTTFPLVEMMAVLERLAQGGPFQNPPQYLDNWKCDYTYEFVMDKGGMRFFVQHYDEPKVLVYEEQFVQQDDQLWKRVVKYDWHPFF